VDEFDTPDFRVTDATGHPVIPVDAHVRLAAFENNGGLRILRRGYSYTDGIDPVRGSLDAGLFFIAFMKHPDQFITLQRKLGASDALVEYIAHVGSAVFACPPGLSETARWGDDLFT
jgi:deferrochelatase/peroxidase EfeB